MPSDLTPAVQGLGAGRATYVTGDVRDCLAAMPDGSVDLVLTSPPFLALRSYLPADHPDKHREIGAEPDPAGFLDTLLGLTAEFRRVLAPHGSICVELGDTYSGSGGAGGDYAEGGLRQGQNGFTGSAARNRHEQPRQWSGGTGWPLPKSLCGIPHLYHLSLAYGRNLLTGQESPAGQWRVRNVVAWCRPNPPVGALGDKFRPATSYMTIACVEGSRYFDLDAVRDGRYSPRSAAGKVDKRDSERAKVGLSSGAPGKDNNPAGAPPLDYWEIPTQPYSGSHYAVYPPALLERPLKSMVPQKVCRTCGEPSRRIVESNGEGTSTRGLTSAKELGGGRSDGSAGWERTVTTTIGFTDCGHDDWRPGIVLDPFAGSGTTLMVATGLGRTAIGFDIDERNVELARDRVGPMLLDDIRLDDTSAVVA